MHTQCPECKTKFRVNDDQLRVALGQVRCSRCHITFNALEFLRTPNASTSEIEGTQADPDTDFLSDMDEFSDLKAQISDDLCPFKDSETITAPSEPKNSIDEELSDVLRELEEFQLNTRQQTAVTPPNEIETPPLDEPVTLGLAATKAPEQPVAFEKPGLQDQLLMNDILGNKTPTKKSGSIRWSIGILTLLLLALSQLSWFGRDKLMHYPEGRMLLKNTCNFIGCELPTIRAPEQIQVLSRSITSHPQMENALLIQLTIGNKANFSQPYPVLQISLYSSEELLVVQRRFKPGEYMTYNNPSMQLDPGKALYLELEINDPGKDVTGFKLEFF
ncbi:MAG: DUF3426 domain-containing protein [Gammaproteobacteria bacterium]|nr:DUF3426 domain-containing protein [Gammaproteobacteria bacterium]